MAAHCWILFEFINSMFAFIYLRCTSCFAFGQVFGIESLAMSCDVVDNHDIMSSPVLKWSGYNCLCQSDLNFFKSASRSFHLSVCV